MDDNGFEPGGQRVVAVVAVKFDPGCGRFAAGHDGIVSVSAARDGPRSVAQVNRVVAGTAVHVHVHFHAAQVDQVIAHARVGNDDFLDAFVGLFVAAPLHFDRFRCFIPIQVLDDKRFRIVVGVDLFAVIGVVTEVQRQGAGRFFQRGKNRHRTRNIEFKQRDLRKPPGLAETEEE